MDSVLGNRNFRFFVAYPNIKYTLQPVCKNTFEKILMSEIAEWSCLDNLNVLQDMCFTKVGCLKSSSVRQYSIRKKNINTFPLASVLGF